MPRHPRGSREQSHREKSLATQVRSQASWPLCPLSVHPGFLSPPQAPSSALDPITSPLSRRTCREAPVLSLTSSGFNIGIIFHDHLH